MKAACAADGVKTAYMEDESTPTGCCAVLIPKGSPERSLCTNLNAANNFKVEHLKKPENWAICEAAKIIYSAGFFITVCPDAMKAACAEAEKHDGLYCVNLSAPFLMQVPPFKAVFNELMPKVDFLFGNETEAQTWADTEGWDTKDVAFIATRLSLIPSDKGKYRYVVMTQGSEPTIIAYRGTSKEYPIIKLPKEKIVDTNGAGDVYVGGFIAGLAKGFDIKKCHEAGAYAAKVIIQQSGCAFPGKPEHKW